MSTTRVFAALPGMYRVSIDIDDKVVAELVIFWVHAIDDDDVSTIHSVCVTEFGSGATEGDDNMNAPVCIDPVDYNHKEYQRVYYTTKVPDNATVIR